MQGIRLTYGLSMMLWVGNSLFSAGCGSVVIPLPPPTMTATSLTQMDAGHLAVDAGFAPTVGLPSSASSPGLSVANTTSLLPVSVRYGVNERLDLTATWGARAIYHLGGLHLGYRLYQGEALRLGLTAGLGFLEHHGSYTVEGAPVVDSEGNQVYDDEGNPVYEPDEIKEFAAIGLSPALGLRTEWQFYPDYALVGAVRVSYGKIFSLYGDVSEAALAYLEPELGIVARPLDGLKVGLGLSLGWPMLGSFGGAGAFSMVPTLSASYAFPVRRGR